MARNARRLAGRTVSCGEERHATDAGPVTQANTDPTQGVAAHTSPPATRSDPLTSDLLQC